MQFYNRIGLHHFWDRSSGHDLGQSLISRVRTNVRRRTSKMTAVPQTSDRLRNFVQFLAVGTLTTATLALLLAEFPFGTLAVEQYRQIFAALYVSLCRAAGRPYAREVVNRALCDAINDRRVAIKFLQSLNGPAKLHPPTLLFMSL